MKDLYNSLKDKRTYLLVAAAALTILAKYLGGELDLLEAIRLGAEALGLGTLRAAVG